VLLSLDGVPGTAGSSRMQGRRSLVLGWPLLGSGTKRAMSALSLFRRDDKKLTIGLP
jgi:hypothetical protein